jgi:hypothetical protein
VSVGRLDEDGYQALIGGGELAICEPRERLLAKVKWSVSRLYLLTVKLSSGTCLIARGEAEVWRWHGRLTHLNFQAMKKMVREDLVCGLPELALVEHLCEACMAGKQKRSSFLAKAQYRTEKCLSWCTVIFVARSLAQH